MSWFQNLFRRRLKNADVTKMSRGDLIELVSRYGAALEKHAATGSVVSDISLLPATKDDLRKVLIAFIATTQDETQREQLKSAYVMLADFQPGVGKDLVKIDALDIADGIQAGAAKVAAQAEEVIRWQTAAAAEGARLMEDIQKLGV